MPVIKERLARYAHSAWKGWMKYMFSKSNLHPDGSVTIPAEYVQRWQRQMHTAYSDLPAEEQKSDQAEADRIMEIVTGNWFDDKDSL